MREQKSSKDSNGASSGYFARRREVCRTSSRPGPAMLHRAARLRSSVLAGADVPDRSWRIDLIVVLRVCPRDGRRITAITYLDVAIVIAWSASSGRLHMRVYRME